MLYKKNRRISRLAGVQIKDNFKIIKPFLKLTKMSENWVKIQSFSYLHQAELRRDILHKNDIDAIIVNAKDSLLPVGEIDLYVLDEDEHRAIDLIEEFGGMTKINSFIEREPIEYFQNLLSNAGIETTLKVTKTEKYIKDNFELYISNENVAQVVPFLSGEKITDHKIILTTKKTRQAKYYSEILKFSGIESFVIKKKDSDYHLEEIRIYVPNESFDKAEKILTDLPGMITVKKSEDLLTMEFFEDKLAYEGIKAIWQKNDNNKYELKVAASEEEKAIEIINIKTEWAILDTFSDIIEASYFRDILEEAGVAAIILNEKDSSFLIGEIELYVEKLQLENARDIIYI